MKVSNPSMNGNPVKQPKPKFLSDSISIATIPKGRESAPFMFPNVNEFNYQNYSTINYRNLFF